MTERQRLEQEMYWLFGEDWRDLASATAYTFALLRIQQRRRQRGRFIVVSIMLSLVAAYVLLQYASIRSFGSDMPVLLPLAMLPLVAIILTAIRHFLLARGLAKRERQAGQAYLSQLAAEAKAKPKRGLALGDDGELVEVESESAQDLMVKAKHR